MADKIPAVSASAPVTSDADVAPSAPAIETPAVAEIAPPQAAPTPIETVSVAPSPEIKATAAELGASPRANIAAEAAPASTIVKAPAPGNRYALLAATVVLAAGLGVVAGAVGAYGFIHVGSADAAVAAPASEKTAVLQSTVARMQTELAALRSSVETATRATNGQFAKVTERFDRIDRSQTERAAKFTKAVETLERLEKRTDIAPARETTGSIPAAQPAAATPAQAPQQPQQSQQPHQPILEGWVVRNVYRGTAVIQNRRLGTIDVEPGDVLPGAGRVESIKKQEGRWVVVTSRGLITSMR